MKIDKLYQVFAQWCYCQTRFSYNQYLNKWVSLQYKPKTTKQLFAYYLKHTKTLTHATKTD